MNLHKLVVTSLILITFSGCAGTLPPPQLLDQRNAGIGIYIENRAPIGLFTNQPKIVYFIRLDGSDSTSLIKNSLIPSNYLKDEYTYLLNVPPGRYAAVLSSRSQFTQGGHYSFNTYFSSELIKLTEIVVKSREITFMGRFLIDQSVGLKGADNVQLHYYRLHAPGHENRSVVGALFNPSGGAHYKGDLLEAHQSNEDRAEFVKKAKEHFKESDWFDLLHSDPGSFEEPTHRLGAGSRHPAGP